MIEGEQIPFSDQEISKLTDWARVKKLYKLNALGGSGGGGGKKKVNGFGAGNEGGRKVEDEKDREDERRELEVLVLGSMALKGST